MEDRMTIVLDPGHGGDTQRGGSSPNKAVGATPRRLLEKDLTLKVASLLAQNLGRDFDVSLTRAGDVNLSLADRAAVARTKHADLFVSIHFNASSDPAVDGTEVWVAQQASTPSRSLAQVVQDRLLSATGVANRGVREANLGVLLPWRHDPRTAACLVEVAFLTNPNEASRLEDEAYLRRIADALATAFRTQVPKSPAHAASAGNGNGHYYGDYAASSGAQSDSDVYSRPLYDTGEHVLTGAANYANQLRVGKSPGVLFSYGQIIAMGDLYEDVDQMMAADPGELNRVKTLIERSTEYYRTHKTDKSKDVKNQEWETVTSHRYLKLADDNYHHFSPNFFLTGAEFVSAARLHRDNKSEWQKYHKRAIDQVRSIFIAGNQKVSVSTLGPLTTNAFGDHFLTDAFAAGHLINKAAVIQLFKSSFFSGKSLKSEGGKFFDKLADMTFNGYLKEQFSNLEETTRHFSHLWHKFNITNASRFATVLKGVAEKAPTEIGNLAVKALHDQLTKDGLEASNEAGDKPWKLTGDGKMNDENLAIIQKAVQQSIDNINDPSILVIDPNRFAPFDYERYYKKVWRFVPQLTAASRQRVQDELRVYTDPSSAQLVSAAAALLLDKDYVDILIQKLIDAKALEWDT